MNNIRIFNLPLTVFSDENLHEILLDYLTQKKGLSFHGYSIDTLYLMRVIPNLYLYREVNDVFLCDGRGIYYFFKLLGVNGLRKTSLPDLTLMLVDVAREQNLSIFLLGASEESNTQAVKNLRCRYGVVTSFGHNGYFSESDELSIVNEINKLSPNVLLLGMSSPKKEEFVYRWKNVLRVGIIVHCGGMIDVLSGKTKLYPKWVKDLCLAGLFRFLQEPKRLMRDFLNIFPALVTACHMLYYKQILKAEYDYPSRYLIERH